MLLTGNEALFMKNNCFKKIFFISFFYHGICQYDNLDNCRLSFTDECNIRHLYNTFWIMVCIYQTANCYQFT